MRETTIVRRCEDNHVVVLSNLKKETLFLWNQQVLLVAALQMIGFIFTNVTRIDQIMSMCKLCMHERFQFRQCWKGSERERVKYVWTVNRVTKGSNVGKWPQLQLKELLGKLEVNIEHCIEKHDWTLTSMASAVAGSIAGSIGSSLLGFGANLLTSKGRTFAKMQPTQVCAWHFFSEIAWQEWN